MHATVRYARKRLLFICVSLDRLHDYEVIPVDSFNPDSGERRRLYLFLDDDDSPASSDSFASDPSTVSAADAVYNIDLWI